MSPRCAVLLLVLVLPARAWSQQDLVPNEEEALAWEMTQLERYVDARETAEGILRQDPRSIMGHAVLGVAQRYGEGNLPRSLYHLRRARALLEERFGAAPVSPGAVQWHARIIMETAFTAGEMERFEEELSLWALHDSLYQPPMVGERIWPLMRLRRFDEARAWALRAYQTGDLWERRQALNGLCAIENEAGNRLESYRWCTAHAREADESAFSSAVYLCNAGEAARSIFRLDEAERHYLEAARRDVAWYANPWMHLADLYLRAGRVAETAVAVRNMHEYARRRPPHTQQQDASERSRTVASLFVVAGRADRALALTERAVLFPDRRGGQSRSPEADRVTAALLHRRALLDSAEEALESGAVEGAWGRARARLRASWLRIRAWRASRAAVALLEDQELLRGLLEAEGRMAQGTPPWLASDLVGVAGPAPVVASIVRARSRLPVPELAAYLDAYEAEAAAASGDWDRAEALAERARSHLPLGEALLRARAQLVLAQAADRDGRAGAAADLYLSLLQTDATLLRRTGSSLPTRIEVSGGEVARRAVRALGRSPRVRADDESAISLRLVIDGEVCRLCIGRSAGPDLECVDAPLEGDDVEARARRCASLLHERLLAPRVDASVLDPSTLEGSTTRGGSVDDLLGPTAPAPPPP